jgi:hypothetical protein
MMKAEIFLTRADGSPDDTIRICETEDSRDLFIVTYRTPDYVNRKRFIATEHRVLDYVEDIVRSLQHDTDPFEFFQVSTVIHPSIMYHVSDLDSPVTRELVINMIRTAMRTDVESL